MENNALLSTYLVKISENVNLDLDQHQMKGGICNLFYQFLGIL